MHTTLKQTIESHLSRVILGEPDSSKAAGEYGRGNVAARKRAIVRVETSILSVIRPPGSSIDLWCGPCATIAPMVTPEHAARLLGTAPRAIYRLVESGGVHFTEIDSGGLLVCVNSLPQT